MSLADELRKLQELRDAGTLTEAEFAKAKAALLAAPGGAPAPPPPFSPAPLLPDALGAAAKTWVSFQIVAAVIGAVIFVVFFLVFFLPQWNKVQDRQDQLDKDWNKTRQEQDEFRKKNFGGP